MQPKKMIPCHSFVKNIYLNVILQYVEVKDDRVYIIFYKGT